MKLNELRDNPGAAKKQKAFEGAPTPTQIRVGTAKSYTP